MIHALLWVFLLLPRQSSEQALPADVLALLQLGLEAENHGDFSGAIAAFGKAADLAPSSPVVFLRLGDAYIKNRDYAAAIPPLKHASELSPDSPPVRQLLGYALLAEGYASEAIPHLQAVHEYGALGIAQLQAGHPGQAVENLQTALANNPDDPDLLYYLYRAATSLSSQSMVKLLTVFPDTARGHQARGQNYFDLKMFPEASKEYEAALAKRPDAPGLRLELGQIYAAGGEWEKAEEQFRLEIKLQPGNSEAAYRMGDALLQQGKMKEAAEALRRSNDLRPDMSETLYSLGRAIAVGDPSSAEHAFNRVIELEKNTPLAARAFLALSGIHRRQGKIELAAQDLQEYRRIEAVNKPRQSTAH
jgi:tetratricopeptide (TPR) repeat protein